MPEISGAAAQRGGILTSAGIVLLVALVVFPLFFAQSMGRSLSHDEHQHLAAGVLIARECLLPYRDFAYLHPPVLPLIYSLFLGHCEYLLLATRAFSAVCASLIAAVLFLAAFRAFAGHRPAWRMAIAAAAVLLLLASPAFVFTVGRTSNHELSILFALLAILCHLAALRTGRPAPLFFSGLLLAMAVGTRVTFAPLGAPFLAALFFIPSAGRQRTWLKQFGIFAAGGVLGGLPMLWLFIEAPAQFLFGVLQFSQANLDYRAATGNPQNMTLLPKLRFLFKEIAAPNFAVCAAAIVPLVCFEWQRRRANAPFPVGVIFLLSLVPFLLMGSLAPSPVFEQYFGVFAPFLLLVGISCGARLDVSDRFALPALAAIAAVLTASVIMVFPDYRTTLAKFPTPQDWTPIKRHREALALRQYAAGTVLTLAPLHPLEAGLKIVPAFATGPFAWRVAEFIPPKKRRQLGIVGAEDLEKFLRPNPPAAILLGQEKRWESALLEYAQRHGYRKIPIGSEDKAIWLKPAKWVREKNARPAR